MKFPLIIFLFLTASNLFSQTQDTLRIQPGYGIDSVNFFYSNFPNPPKYRSVTFIKRKYRSIGCGMGRPSHGRTTSYENDSLGISLYYSTGMNKFPQTLFARKKNVSVNVQNPKMKIGKSINISSKPADVILEFGMPDLIQNSDVIYYSTGISFCFIGESLYEIHLFEPTTNPKEN